MATTDGRAKAGAMLMSARILWAALLASTVMVLGTLVFLGERAHREPVAMMLPLLGLVAMTVTVLSFVLPNLQYKQALARLEIDVVDKAAPTTSDVLPAAHASVRRIAKKPLKALRKAFAIYQTKLIFSCALAETVALMGFVLGFQGHPLPHALPFFVVSWALMLLHFPTLTKILSPVEAKFHARILSS